MSVGDTGEVIEHQRKLDIKSEPSRQSIVEASFTRTIVEEQLPGGECAAHLRLCEHRNLVESMESAKLWLVTVEWQFVMRRGGVYAYWERALSEIGALQPHNFLHCRRDYGYTGTVHLRPPTMLCVFATHAHDSMVP